MAAVVGLRESKHAEGLLPGFLDDIVLYHIVPKLSWKDFYILASVSRVWYDAIRSRRVFESRILRHSFDTLIAYYNSRSATIALYSMIDNSWHELPPIADASEGQNDKIPRPRFPPRPAPRLSQCIAMDRKIYVLGGVVHSAVSNKVFVFDVAGGGNWKPCASMNQCRQEFGIAIMDGKIYVFGGITNEHAQDFFLDRGHPLLSKSEVYEPKEDTWSPIRGMPTCRYGQHVAQIGEELFTCGGRTYDGAGWRFREEYTLAAYHPSKDEWRVVGNTSTWKQPWPELFCSGQGSLFSIRAHGLQSFHIHKYDVHGNAWIYMDKVLLSALPIPVEYVTGEGSFSVPHAILVVDGDFIALVKCGKRKERTRGLCLFQSTGFGGENGKISWKLRATTFGHKRSKLRYGAEYFVQKL